MDSQRKHVEVVMLPWLAQGHITPFFNLSKTLAKHEAIKVSILSTPVNISRIKERLQPGDSIELLEIPLPSVDGLPAGDECTADIEPEIAHLLHEAFDKLAGPLETLLRSLSPDFLIHDLLAVWAAPIAAELGIHTLAFSVYSPAAFSYVLSHSKHRPVNGVDKTPEDLSRPAPGYPSAAISMHPFEARQMVRLFMASHQGPTVSELGYQYSWGILIKSCFEEEDKYLQYLSHITGKPVISVGPLMLLEGRVGVEDEDGDHELVKWLDKQEASSVVFVAFGSESFLSAEQITELAFALEDTGRPFLWSLRSSEGTRTPLSFLPEGFEGRTRERGMVIGGWVPQQRIVSHSSVGSYVTHGGWSSVMEAWLYSGLPLVLIPLRNDQGLNCRHIARELNAGVEVERTEEGLFRREDVCQAVNTVMGDDKRGAEIRSRVEALRGVIVFNGGRRHAVIRELVDHMKSMAVSDKAQ
ncbi:hypothetical protein SUGI_0657290 [Cryptomeria japonica]|uniref:anthocyanidin-3-O-glucoside rhamnosyltransferase n=1 Tax=Cryptomeria japonica TaxID=3369 RepID=UPI002414754E|nr:anthocyanidin-3-O-glucoside rhamnosyltransferase [Cryptomeria japonica]GLJ32667.1 hypothetical protein SUGI_0657290 [Cryptomeria japonica]